MVNTFHALKLLYQVLFLFLTKSLFLLQINKFLELLQNTRLL